MSAQLSFDSIDEADRAKDDILWIIRHDPKNKPSVQAVAKAITDAGYMPGDWWSANDLRRYLPPWINTPSIGASLNGLAIRGVIRKVGEVPSTKQNTHGKRVYRWTLT